MPGMELWNLSFVAWGRYVLLPIFGVMALSYFLGCSNGAVLVSKYILRDDVRTHGSGNAGLTNFYRTFGGPLTLLVILSDVLKAVLAIQCARLIYSLIGGMPGEYADVMLRYWAGLWCLVGHMFPCMFHFKGGKGILSGGAVVLMLDWRIALVAWGIFLILAVLTRYVSLGSCIAGIAFPVMSLLVYRSIPVTVLSVVIGALILWQHRGNIQRLCAGTESKFSLKKVRD